MQNRERILIYGALVLLIGLNVAVLAGGGRAAQAADPPEAPALGPADTLTLAGATADDKPVVLRDAGGRLAWGDSEYARAYSIGFMHVGQAMGPLLEAEAYAEEYGQLEAELRAHDDELGAAIDTFLEEHKDMKPDDPDLAQVQQTYRAMMQQREQSRMDAGQQLGKLAAEQIERAYRDLIAAVEVVAARRGIDIVYRFIPTSNEFKALNPPQAYTGIRARILLKYPQGLDITDEVLEELAIEVK